MRLTVPSRVALKSASSSNRRAKIVEDLKHEHGTYFALFLPLFVSKDCSDSLDTKLGSLGIRQLDGSVSRDSKKLSDIIVASDMNPRQIFNLPT